MGVVALCNDSFNTFEGVSVLDCFVVCHYSLYVE